MTLGWRPRDGKPQPLSRSATAHVLSRDALPWNLCALMASNTDERFQMDMPTTAAALPRPRRALWKMLLLGAFAGSAAGLGFIWYLCRLEEQGNGGLSVFMLEMGMSFLWLCAVLVGMLSLLLPKLRRMGLAMLIACAVMYATHDGTRHWIRETRLQAFERLAARSQPLVDAIHAYERLHSVPPPDLAALVPEFLPEVPGTDMPSYPEFTFELADDFPDPDVHWILKVPCSKGPINWDEFIYSPKDTFYDPNFDPVTRLGEWIYLHE